jgi:hypothetical protein
MFLSELFTTFLKALQPICSKCKSAEIKTPVIETDLEWVHWRPLKMAVVACSIKERERK